MKNKNLLFSFEELATTKDKATNAATRYFTQAGAQVLSADTDGKTRRSSGISYRELTFTFNDSQKVVMRIKATGDVAEVLLNGALLAIKNQDDHVKAIGEIVAAMGKGRAAFQKKLAAATVKLPPAIKTAAPKMAVALRQKRDALIETIAAIDEEINGMRAEMAQAA